MALPGFPFPHSIVTTVGAAAGSPITIPGIAAWSSTALLAVIMHDAEDGWANGTDPSAWEIAAGTITSADYDSAGHYVTVIYANGVDES